MSVHVGLPNSLPWFYHIHFLDRQCIYYSGKGRFFFEKGSIITTPVLTFFIYMFVTSLIQASRNNIPGVSQCDKEERLLCWNFSGCIKVWKEYRKEESQEVDDKVQTKPWNGT